MAENSRRCIKSTLANGEPTAFDYTLEIKGTLRKYSATFSKFSNEEVIVLVQEIISTNPATKRKRAAGKQFVRRFTRRRSADVATAIFQTVV